VKTFLTVLGVPIGKFLKVCASLLQGEGVDQSIFKDCGSTEKSIIKQIKRYATRRSMHNTISRVHRVVSSRNGNALNEINPFASLQFTATAIPSLLRVLPRDTYIPLRYYIITTRGYVWYT